MKSRSQAGAALLCGSVLRCCELQGLQLRARGELISMSKACEGAETAATSGPRAVRAG